MESNSEWTWLPACIGRTVNLTRQEHPSAGAFPFTTRTPKKYSSHAWPIFLMLVLVLLLSLLQMWPCRSWQAQRANVSASNELAVPPPVLGCLLGLPLLVFSIQLPLCSPNRRALLLQHLLLSKLLKLLEVTKTPSIIERFASFRIWLNKSLVVPRKQSKWEPYSHLQLLVGKHVLRKKPNISVGIILNGNRKGRGLPQGIHETSAMVKRIQLFVHPHPCHFPCSRVKQIPSRWWGRDLGRTIWATMAQALSASASAAHRAQRRLRWAGRNPSLQNEQ